MLLLKHESELISFCDSLPPNLQAHHVLRLDRRSGEGFAYNLHASPQKLSLSSAARLRHSTGNYLTPQAISSQSLDIITRIHLDGECRHKNRNSSSARTRTLLLASTTIALRMNPTAKAEGRILAKFLLRTTDR